MGRTALALFWLSTLGSLVYSRTADDRLRWTADVQEGTQRSGKTVHILSGNVKFWKGEMELYTDGAIYYPGSDHADLSGNVVMLRPGERLTCESLVLLNAEDELIARGDVVMVQDNRLLHAEEFHHLKTDGPRGASFQASGGVTMEEGDRFLAARRMDFDDLAGLLDLQGDAAVREEGRELRGAHIRMVYQGEVPHRILVEGGAEATARVRAQVSSVRRDWHEFEDLLTSRTMEGDFADDRLTTLTLMGMASSIYHVVEDSLLQGVNHTSGDTLRLSFDEEGGLERIRVRGGARGRFEPQRGNSDVDTVVVYRAEKIDYDIPGEITYLDQGARVDYKENGLAAGHLEVTWRNNLMRAEEAFDDRPTLHQVGHDPMYGELMEFNLVTEIGRVVRGRTKLENGHYHGELVYRQPGDVYYMRRSLYTTCSLDTPHFYFAARRMKMLQGDKVIAKPIVLYLMDVPVLGLPFAVFPNESGGRRTGWIMPSYGTSNRHGRYLEGLGYFWVINPYLDATTWLDLFDERGIRARGRFRYNRRYQFTGQLAANAFRLVNEDDRNIADLFDPAKVVTKWSASWRHNHTIDPTQRLNVNARFVSDPGIFREHGLDRQTRLTQQAVSSGSYSKSWPGTPFRLTLALQERYDLQAQGRLETPPTRLGQRIEEKSRVLPRLTLGRNRSALLKPAKGAAPRWYHNIYWSFNGSLNNLQSVFWEAETLGVGADSLFWPEPGERQTSNRTWARNRYSIQAQQKLLRYVAVNLNLGVNQDVTRSSRLAQEDPSTSLFLTDSISGDVLFDPIEKLALRHTGSLSLTARTTLYGLFPVGIGSLESIRHVIKPSISYRFSPDFSRPLLGYDFGYFQTDENGETFDRFAGSPIGRTPSRESQSIGFSLSNLFQAKQVRDGEEIKTTLLNWNMSSSYNFTADSLRLAPIRSSFRSPFLQRLRVDLRMEHDFYNLDPVTHRRVKGLRRLPRLSFMSASSTLRLSGKRFAGYARVPAEAPAEAVGDSAITDPELDGQLSFRRRVVEPAIAPDNLWEATLGLRYGLRPSLRPPARETFSLGGDFKINIGPGWKVRYTARFDVLKQELISHDLQLYRQLHCWEFSFSWTPSGTWRGFMLRINVRDGDLRDIKYESRGGQQSFLGVY